MKIYMINAQDLNEFHHRLLGGLLSTEGVWLWWNTSITEAEVLGVKLQESRKTSLRLVLLIVAGSQWKIINRPSFQATESAHALLGSNSGLAIPRLNWG
jgi:hypothetical protein